MLNNGNASVAPPTIVNGQNSSESPSPGINNNNAPKYGTPVSFFFFFYAFKNLFHELIYVLLNYTLEKNFAS